MLLINQIGLELFGLRDNTCFNKIFKSANINLINDIRLFFSFLLSSEILEKRKHSFMCCTNILHYYVLSVD